MKKNPIPSVGVVAIQGNKILLVREGEKSGHITGVYGLPSGRLNSGETEQQAAAREFWEETGLKANLTDFVEFPGNYFEAEIPRKDGTVRLFGWRIFKVLKFSGVLKASNETIPEWLDIDMLQSFEDEKKLLPNTIEAVRAANSE